MKTRASFVSNSSSSSFILPKKELSLEQLEGFTSWVTLHNKTGHLEDTYINETVNYFFGSVNKHCGIKEQLAGLNIPKESYDLEDD